MTDDTAHPKLNVHIPRPELAEKRHMIAVSQSAYDFITELAEELKTSRNKVVSALVQNYKDSA